MFILDRLFLRIEMVNVVVLQISFCQIKNTVMAAKSAISGEYIIQKEESGSIVVYRIYDNSKGALREIAQKIGFEYDEKWNVRQFGAKLIDFINENK
jgi:hypothetical protein